MAEEIPFPFVPALHPGPLLILFSAQWVVTKHELTVTQQNPTGETLPDKVMLIKLEPVNYFPLFTSHGTALREDYDNHIVKSPKASIFLGFHLLFLTKT